MQTPARSKNPRRLRLRPQCRRRLLRLKGKVPFLATYSISATTSPLELTTVHIGFEFCPAACVFN